MTSEKVLHRSSWMVNGATFYLVGNSVIRPQFEAAMTFREGLARVSVGGLWGFIDHSGAFVIEPQFAMVYDLDSGLSVTGWKKRGPKGYINKSGRCVIEPAYEHAKNFSEGFGRRDRIKSAV